MFNNKIIPFHFQEINFKFSYFWLSFQVLTHEQNYSLLITKAEKRWSVFSYHGGNILLKISIIAIIYLQEVKLHRIYWALLGYFLKNLLGIRLFEFIPWQGVVTISTQIPPNK